MGDRGRVYCLDVTEAMLDKLRNSARKLDVHWLVPIHGNAEAIPLPEASVDVITSNGVLNLVPDKQQAFGEIFRVLKPGGHFCISDVVSSQELPDWVKGVAEAYAGCVAGAIPKEQYLQLIQRSGFTRVEVASERRIHVPESLLNESLTMEQQKEAAQNDLHVMSVTVKGFKPA